MRMAEQKSPQKKAWETRKANEALRADGKEPQKKTNVRTGPKVRFRKLTDTSTFAKVHIDTPVDLYIHKELKTIYITPSESIITK
jgi:hypothetical protein